MWCSPCLWPLDLWFWTYFVPWKVHFEPKKCFSLKIFVRIRRFIWNLGLVSYDSPKDVDSGKILVFAKIFGFPGVNWAQRWTKTEKFGCIPVVLKHLILKHCSHPVFLLWWTTSGPNFNKIEPYFGEKGPRNSQKGPISWLPHCHENIWKFITLEPQMAERWNLPQLCIFMRPLLWQNIWAWDEGCGKTWLKNLWKKTKKLFFWLLSWNFKHYIKTYVISDTLPWTASVV